MKLMTLITALLFATAAQAQTWAERTESWKETWQSGSDTVRILTGAHADAGHIGLDYEHRMGPAGLGVSLYQTAKSIHLDRPAVTTLALTTPVHLMDRTAFDIYLAPGINFSNFKDVDIDADGSKSDKATYGFMLKTGIMYHYNKMISFGLDYSEIHNLNERKAPDEISVTSFGLGYSW